MTDYLTMTQEQLSELADKAGELESDLESLKKETEDYEQYRDFFRSCFERLDKHYPCAEVTSDYDCSVIFDAIEAGEAARQENEGD